MATLSDLKTEVENSAMSNSPQSVAASGNSPALEESAPSNTANPKPAVNVFPPPKTDKPRPHICTTCDRSFARLEHLKRHERSHTKEKPFECPECTRCFARRDLLLRHQQKLHQSTAPPSRPRKSDLTGGGPGPTRARKNSVASMNASAAAAASMRPRANTISHFDNAAIQHIQAANAAVARGMPPTHSRHASLTGYPLQGLEEFQGYPGMSAAMGQRGMAHGLPKLDTHGLNTMAFGGSLRTAPISHMHHNHEFDFDLYGPSTINPSALHYSQSPHSMIFDPVSSFVPTTMHDMSSNASYDSIAWLTRMGNMSVSGHNDTAIMDGSSPSALSTNSPDGLNSELMLDGSNDTKQAAAANANANWQAATMAPPPMTNPFAMDLSMSGVFPDLMGGETLSPGFPPQKGMADAYFHTPSPLGSLSPAVMGFSSMHQSIGSGPGPETPSSSLNGSTHHGSSPVSTITDSTRNAILGALASSTSQGSSLANRRYSTTVHSAPSSSLNPPSAANASSDPLVPSTHDLQRYVGAYLRYFHPHLPFLHVPTLSFEVPAKSASGRSNAVGGSECLILSMAAIGALYEMEHEQSKNLFNMAKKMIQLYLDERRKANVRKADFRRNPVPDSGHPDNSVDTPLWLVQSMLLNVVYGHNCADRRAGEIASTHCVALVSLAQGAGLVMPPNPDPLAEQDVTMEDVENIWRDDLGTSSRDHAQWLRWKSAEERKRTLYVIFILSSLLVAAYNHQPALTNSEILLDLPCKEDLFAAPTSSAFFAKGGLSAANHNRVKFHDALGQLLRTNDKYRKNSGRMPNGAEAPSSGLQPSPFGSLILINALHNYIWETRTRHHNKVWTNEETDKMHRHIEPALRAWHTAWLSDPQHSTERPNPHGAGPLSADAIPLLDLAYVRLFVNMSRTKERFWNRDWDGLAEELSRGFEVVQHAEHSPMSNTESAATDPSDNSVASSAFVDSPPTVTSSPDFVPNAFPASATNGQPPAQSEGSISRREKHLRKAAFFAADSLFRSAKLGITFADFDSRELPLQSAMCAFDCAQVLAEWVATLQERVGKYTGILGQDGVDIEDVPVVMFIEDEDRKLLGKIVEILRTAENKINFETPDGMPGLESLQLGEQVGFAAKILRVTSHTLGKAAVWPVTHLMAECLENHAGHMRARAEKSIMMCQ